MGQKELKKIMAERIMKRGVVKTNKKKLKNSFKDSVLDTFSTISQHAELYYKNKKFQSEEQIYSF